MSISVNSELTLPVKVMQPYRSQNIHVIHILYKDS